MKAPLKRLRIFARLFVVYVVILLLGFGGLALIAGEQISAGAREDYEVRLKGEVVLIAQALASSVDSYTQTGLSDADWQALVVNYETGIGGTLAFVPLDNFRDSDDVGRATHPSFRDAPELEYAIRGEVSLDERQNVAGDATLYTAAPIIYSGRTLGFLQMCVPTSNLEAMIAERWIELGMIGALVALLGIGAAFWLARSIVQPLYKLRESALRLSKGEFSHRVQIENRDEIGEVARAFNDMAIQVESMLEEQRAFASNTSHELRTPLTAIRLRTEALRYDPALDQETARRYIEEIDDEVARLGDLVQDLTLLSRFDAGRAELGQEQVDMLRFAVSMNDRMLPLAREKGITLSLTLPTEGLAVRASLNHLSVIFRNLLDNAIKYTPDGGAISWVIDQTVEGIRHTITDTGNGIEPEYLAHVYERFFRIDKARSRDIPGTGLGLALVKSIVEAYGGTIKIESAGLGKGSTVTVVLPQS